VALPASLERPHRPVLSRSQAHSLVKKRFTHFAFLVVAALVVAACSVSRLAYLNAPPLALWYLGGYVDMTDAQKTLVRDRLSHAMTWHRQAELPQYQRALEHLATKTESRISVEDARTTYKQARDYYDRAIDHLVPDLADFLLTLDASQLERMENKFADDNKKIVKELKGSDEERRVKRAKKYIDQFEEYTGKLDTPQREIILNLTRNLPDLTEDRLEDRRYRQREVLELIRAKPSRDQLVAKLRKLLVDTESWRRAEYKQKLRARDERLFEVVAELSATLTPEQRGHLQKKVRTYVKDISSIIASR
jgi:hypothetical protein